MTLRAETAHQLSSQLMVLSCQPSHVAGNLQQPPQEKFMLVNRAPQKGQSPLVPSQPPGSIGAAYATSTQKTTSPSLQEH